MQFLKKINPAPIPLIQMGLFILIELQLLLGKEFTTFHVYGPFHLSDTLLALIAIAAVFALIKKGVKIPVIAPLFVLLGISLVYLAYSVVASLGPMNYIVRHYALFIYIALSYLIFYSFINKDTARINLKFIILVGFVAVIAQLLTHLYNFITIENYWSRVFTGFNFLTELIMPGVVIFEVWVLVTFQNLRRKIAIVVLVLFFTTTLGHASAFLASFIPVLLYLLSNLKLRPLFLIAGTVVSLVILFLLLPQFNDVNAMWRILYWREVIKDGILNNYLIFGNGFGGAFITENMNQSFLSELGSIHFDVNPEEKFLTPMHNSFVTIMFHIGILPGLLVFIPLANSFKWFFKYDTKSQSRMFLFLSFIGFAVWSAFNVILEMPHSSTFFWLLYFSVVYEFSDKNEKAISFTLPKL